MSVATPLAPLSPSPLAPVAPIAGAASVFRTRREGGLRPWLLDVGGDRPRTVVVVGD